MKVFISWSGKESAGVAKVLHEWIPLVLQQVEPWMSEVDIQPGTKWNSQIQQELEAANFGIICLTHENLSSPWIFFEAGALAKGLREDRRIIPLLCSRGLKASAIAGDSPLAPFQATQLDKVSFLDVLESINKVASPRLDENRLHHVYKLLWPHLEAKLRGIPHDEAPAPPRPADELQSDLLLTVRAVDARLRGIEDQLRQSTTVNNCGTPGDVVQREPNAPV